MVRKVALCAVVALLCSCGQPSTQGTGIVHDPCAPLAVLAPQNATAGQTQSIADAVAMWNALGLTKLTAGENGGADRIALSFQEGSGVFFGLYQPEVGDVIINTQVTDPQARAVVIAHELGHAMGLVHIEPAQRVSVMNRGNLTVQPTPADETVLAAHWQACRAP